jgi:hypothetical protein
MGRAPPLAVALSAANRHDSTLLEQVIDAVPAIIGPRGRPDDLAGARPNCTLIRDDFPRCRKALRRRGISPRVARRGGVQPAAGSPSLEG